MTVVPPFVLAQRRQAGLFHERAPSQPPAGSSPQPLQRPRRLELLRERLPAVVAHLQRKRLDLVEEGFVADYLALRWLVWRDGDLRLSEIGQVVFDSATAEAAASPGTAGGAREGSDLTVVALMGRVAGR